MNRRQGLRFVRSACFRLLCALSLGIVMYGAFAVLSFLTSIAIGSFTFPSFDSSSPPGSQFFSSGPQSLFAVPMVGFLQGASLLATGFSRFAFDTAFGSMRFTVSSLPVSTVVLLVILFISSRLLERFLPSKSLKEKILLSLSSSVVVTLLALFSLFVSDPTIIYSLFFLIFDFLALFLTDLLGRLRLRLTGFIRESLFFVTLFVVLGFVVLVVLIVPSYTEFPFLLSALVIYSVPLSVVFAAYAGGAGFFLRVDSVYEKVSYFHTHMLFVLVLLILLFFVALRLAAMRKPCTKKQALSSIWHMPTAVFLLAIVLSCFTAGFSISPVVPSGSFVTVEVGMNGVIFAVLLMAWAYLVQVFAIYAAPFVARRIPFLYRIIRLGVRKRGTVSRKQIKRVLKGLP
ncbi:hypothetical protein [Tropheryma whipplei]|uniref:Uncharacterized protein n=1 Tax=Tropheryma whipplei (strain Twist) TaxID=203267 RepID=Q83G47_TROWT|nr:hypothetical protein [Tropheryma whipplei]AAO44579.1 unknown [Tropheryma whipplei str. Twist]